MVKGLKHDFLWRGRARGAQEPHGLKKNPSAEWFVENHADSQPGGLVVQIAVAESGHQKHGGSPPTPPQLPEKFDPALSR